MQLITGNRDFLSIWLPPFPEKICLNQVEEWISQEHKLLQNAKRVDLGVFADKTGVLIGRVSLHSILWGIQRSAAMSYWIDEKYGGRGFATEAAATLTSFAFEEMRLHRVCADILLKNKPSLAICQKLGFRNEGLGKKSLFINGNWQDTQNFALLEEEYEQIAEKWIKKGFLGV
jgi:ribosomal-protein-alanine N-acetyltransferase